MLRSVVLPSLLQTWSTQGKVTRLPVQGNSMVPLLRPGYTVVIQHDVTGVRFGDLVLRWAAPESQILLVHRVVRAGRDEGGSWYITKGDRWLHFDSLARGGDLVGKVVAVETGESTVDLTCRFWRILSRLLALRSLAEGWLRARIVANVRSHVPTF